MHPADSNYEISLDSKRTIALDELHQHLTYAGLLEGLPTRRINKDFLLEIKNVVHDKIWGSTIPYIITPHQAPIKLSDERKEYYKNKGPNHEPLVLPKITCIGHFTSNAITDDFMFSNLTIVWLQEDWAIPIDSMILKQIKCIHWDKYANQGDY